MVPLSAVVAVSPRTSRGSFAGDDVIFYFPSASDPALAALLGPHAADNDTSASVIKTSTYFMRSLLSRGPAAPPLPVPWYETKITNFLMAPYKTLNSRQSLSWRRSLAPEM